MLIREWNKLISKYHADMFIRGGINLFLCRCMLIRGWSKIIPIYHMYMLIEVWNKFILNTL